MAKPKVDFEHDQPKVTVLRLIDLSLENRKVIHVARGVGGRYYAYIYVSFAKIFRTPCRYSHSEILRQAFGFRDCIVDDEFGEMVRKE